MWIVYVGYVICIVSFIIGWSRTIQLHRERGQQVPWLLVPLGAVLFMCCTGVPVAAVLLFIVAGLS
jgi:hypothetical protein